MNKECKMNKIIGPQDAECLFNPALLACAPATWQQFCAASIEAARRAGAVPTESATGNAATDPLLPKVPGIAVIPVDGILLQTVPAWYRKCGVRATGYDEICDGVRKAEADPRVREILLWVNSPGGVAHGPDIAADTIWRAEKRVSAHVAGECLSGAYWLASQADSITASETSRVGGIGCFSVHYDNSAALENAGIRPVVIRSGPLKAIGLDRITEEQRAAEQRIVDATADLFLAAVARGRNWEESTAKFWKGGNSYIAAHAKNGGLIDAVKNLWTPEEDLPPAGEQCVGGGNDKARRVSKIDAVVNAERARCSYLVRRFGVRAVKYIQRGVTVEEAGMMENPMPGDFMRFVATRAANEKKPVTAVMGMVAEEFPEIFNSMRGIMSTE